MLTILTIIAVIILAVIFFVLGVGFFIILGFVLVLVVIAAIISAIFGGLDWNSTSSSMSSSGSGVGIVSSDEALDVIDDFHSCLREADPDPCRAKFTLWDEKDKELIRQLSKQLKEELGKREKNNEVQKIERQNVNGHVKVVVEQQTDYSKKKAVHEHYVLENDPDDKDALKIKDLNWDY